MVERQLPKLKVAGSSPVSRSIFVLEFCESFLGVFDFRSYCSSLIFVQSFLQVWFGHFSTCVFRYGYGVLEFSSRFVLLSLVD